MVSRKHIIYRHYLLIKQQVMVQKIQNIRNYASIFLIILIQNYYYLNG